ncbi:helix-turn-helix domain-containing protein [Dongia sedimenti]|uniref:Helix-turn-helix domain-containing protein n=1 Tax=Dongia sedimenti TaxID=3064282 RepID=A0ABU0YRZ4_9PROT|nr:helix-turn-helix domain-containing protein [Rhodospirillaceae bacterium R-7]
MLAMHSAAESKARRTNEANSKEETEAPFGLGVVLRLKPNETLFSEGDAAASFYQIKEGVIRSFRMMIDGRRQIISFSQPGDYLGLEWEGDRAMTAEAIIDTAVVSYPRRHLEGRATADVRVQNRMMAVLFGGLHNAQEHLVMLGRQTAMEKLGWFLVRLARSSRMNNGALALPMNRTDIADYLGLSMETVSRGFSLLTREGYIALPDAHQVCIRNFKRLDALARGEVPTAH